MARIKSGCSILLVIIASMQAFSAGAKLQSLGPGASFTANLEAAENVEPISPKGLPQGEQGDTGFIDFVINGDTISYVLNTTNNQNVGQIEINSGALNSNVSNSLYPIQIILTGKGQLVKRKSFPRSATGLSPLQSLLNNPSGFHVVVMQKHAQASFMRGQVLAEKHLYQHLEANVVAAGSGDKIPVDTGDGFLDVRILGDAISGPYTLYWTLVTDPLKKLGGGRLTTMHWHKGFPIGNAQHLPSSGSPVVTFFQNRNRKSPGDNGNRPLEGRLKDVPVDVLNAIRTQPFAYYLNVHTNKFPDGEQRGQVEPRVALQTVLRNLDGKLVLPITVVLGNGGATWNIKASALPSSKLYGSSIALHIHRGTSIISRGGAAGGALVISLASDPKGISLTGSVQFHDQDVISQVLLAPTKYYINLHSTTNPGGLADGQLDYVHHSLHSSPIVIQSGVGT